MKATGKNGGVCESPTPASTSGTKDCSIHIVGTDLLPSSIAVAERGVYPQSALTGLAPRDNSRLLFKNEYEWIVQWCSGECERERIESRRQ